MQKPEQDVKRQSFRSGIRRRLRAQQHEDSGNALVLAIASVLLVALLMGVIISSVMFSVGNTTATRAHAASRAAAEGGAQQVARKLLQKSETGSPSCSGLTPPADAWIHYDVEGVWFQEEDGAAWEECGSAGIPKLAHSVRVKTIGYSDSAGTDSTGDGGTRGQQGNKRGDTSVVEMTFVRPSNLDFNKAIFGDNGVTAVSKINVLEDVADPANPDKPYTQNPPDVISNSMWNCNSIGEVAGSVYALGGMIVGSPCVVHGDLYVSGQATVNDKLTVHGNLYIDGNLTTSGTVADGTTLVSGNMSLVQAAAGLVNNFTGDVRLMGDLVAQGGTSEDNFGDRLLLGGAISGQGANDLETGMGTRLVAPALMVGNDWLFPTVMNTPENPMTDADRAEIEFPMLRQDDEAWDGFVEGNLADYGPSPSLCSPAEFSSKIEINVDTAFNLSDCSNFMLQDYAGTGGMQIVLNADLVIFAKSFDLYGEINVVSGNAAGDDTRHSLYVVALPTATQTDCTPGNQGGGIHQTGGGLWNQKDDDGELRTKVLFYSAGKIKINSAPTSVFNGQYYGCNFESQAFGYDMIFAQAGQDRTDTLWDLGIGSVRDITS